MTAVGKGRGMFLRGPATRWQDALPTGNGTIGAMLYGRIADEIILLNHEALYAPCPRSEPRDVSDLLPALRRLLTEGRYQEACRLMPRVHAERGGVPEGSTSDVTDPYQPFGDLRLRNGTAGPFRHYRRGVDFETGRVWASWMEAGTTMMRELFVSRVTDTVVLRQRCTAPGRVSCRIWLARHEEASANPGWHGREPPHPAEYMSGARPPVWLWLTGRYPGAWAFGALARVTASGGTLAVRDGAVAVEGAQEVLVQVKLFVHEPPAEAFARLQAELGRSHADFEAELAAHAAVHAELFSRLTLELDPTLGDIRSNEELLTEAYEGAAPTALVQTMCEFGRHLLICANRPGGWPTNIQGIWNGDYTPAWNADIHTDENVQMNYWAALPGSLPEMVLPLFDYFERFLEDYRANARLLYGCRGILVPIAQTTHGRAFPSVWTLWTAAAGWLAQHFYDYWLFTGDQRFLAERAVPWLREVAQFYEDFLCEGPDGRLLFAPSLSPENTPTGEGMTLATINATMDVAVCREVLSNLCAACELLGIEPQGVARWRAMLARLPAYAVNEDGALREWLHPAFPDNYHHRHLSHLYPVFPGLEITEETEPALHAAARVAAEKRLLVGLTSQSGWSLAHLANVFARLGDGNRALECLDLLLRGCTGPNLFTYHNDWREMGLTLSSGSPPPFQIDANFGFPAAVLEMLVCSKPGLLKLLPALPERWPRGRVCGLSCRGRIRLDIAWDRPAGHLRATLTSRQAQQVHVKLPPGARAPLCQPADAQGGRSHFGDAYRLLHLPADVPVSLEAAFG